MIRSHPAIKVFDDSNSAGCEVATAMGTFRIRPHRTLQGRAELWLDDSFWESYESADAALEALVRGQIGMGEWRGLGIAFCDEAD